MPKTNRYFTIRNRVIIFSILMLMLLIGLTREQRIKMDTGDKENLIHTVRNAPAQRVHNFTKAGQQTLLATNNGLFRFDGAGYQQLIKEETFAVATRDGQHIFAGTRAGVMLSTDGGRSWQVSNQGLTSGVVPLSFAMSSETKIFLGSDRNGIFRSDNGGQSWQAMNNGLPASIGVSPFAAIKHLYHATTNNNIIFAATDSHGLYISRNGGEQWQAADMKLPGGFYHRVSAPLVAFDKEASQTVYALINFPVHSDLLEHIIFRSVDNGLNWTELGKLAPNQTITSFEIEKQQLIFTGKNGLERVNINDLRSIANIEEPQPQQFVLPGTEADFDKDNISVLHDDNAFSFINVSLGDFTQLGAVAARRFYQRHSDDYDVMVVFIDPLYGFTYAGNSIAYNVPINSNIGGLGKPIGTFNGGPALYGSKNGRLQSLLNMSNIQIYPSNPTDPFIQTYSALEFLALHFGHTYSAFYHFNDNGVTSDELRAGNTANWSFFFNSDASVIGGNQFKDEGSGNFSTTAATSRYNGFDRYGMGLTGSPSPGFVISNPTSITPQVLLNGQPIDLNSIAARQIPPLAPPEFPSVKVTGTRKDVTLADIMAIEGPRFPAPSAATSTIKVAFVYLTPAGREPDPEGFEKYKTYRNTFISYFNSATGGLGRIDPSLVAQGGSDTTKPQLKLLFPNGGESYSGNSTIRIAWESSDENGLAKHDIKLSLDGGKTFPITVDPLVNGNTKGIDYELPGQLFGEAKFAIKITAVDHAGNEMSDISDAMFSIEKETSPPVVKVNSPNGGETFMTGTPLQVSWSSSDNGMLAGHDIKLSIDGGKSFPITIASGLDGTIQKFTFLLPEEAATSQAVIEVTARDNAGNVGRDISDKVFRIGAPDNTPPQVQLSTPIGGEKLQAKGQFNISWTSMDNDTLSGHVLALSTNGGQSFDVPIASGLSGTTQNFTWTIPDLEITNARVSITAIDSQGNRAVSTSTSNFAITRQDVTVPIVKVTAPNGGERVRAGEPIMITWQSSDNVAVQTHFINLSIDGGKTFPTQIASGLPGNANSFTFTLPVTLISNDARIEVVALDANGNGGRDASDASFIIEGKDTVLPTVKITSPNGGEILASSDPLQVSWQSTDNVAVVAHDLQISIDGGANYTTVQTGLGGSIQQAVINVSTFQSERVKIRIIARDAANNVGSDDSDNQFALAARPVVNNAQYKDGSQKLTIFASGVSKQSTVMINGQTVSLKQKFNAKKGTITLKGSRSQLNLRSGDNMVVVTERGLSSATFVFNIQ